MSFKNILIFLSFVFLIVLAVAAYFVFYQNDSDEEISNFEQCVKAGYAVMESYPRQCRTADGRNFTEDIGNELEKTDLIKVSYPRPNQTITSPLKIEGEARGKWFFEGDFPVKIIDQDGNLLAIHYATAQDEWMTEAFVPFKSVVEFDAGDNIYGKIILEKDNPSGLKEFDDQLIIPIKFGISSPQETMVIKAFFNNSELDPQVSCDKVFPVERVAPKTQAVARAAIEELLKGVTSQEESQGFFTSISQGVKIQSLTIENNVAKIDFNDQLQFQVGGSCRVSAIRSQIIATLKQFDSVDDVVISINNQIEDILQP